MKKLISFVTSILISCAVFAQPANNNCANAISLTTNAALLCNQVAANATAQAGECIVNWAGGSNATMWYTFTASNDSMILNFMMTTAASPVVSVHGPFATGQGCLPSCASSIYSVQQGGDPGEHILLTGLTTTAGNNIYYVQIDAFVPNGNGNVSPLVFCINVNTPATNSGPTSATILNACGSAFSNTTNGGYWNNGTSPANNNLDGNGTSTCGACTAGDDVTFVINNISWTTFCGVSAGTWSITVSGVSGCTLAAPNQGIQAAVFTGTTSNLTNVGQSPSPIAPGATWNSPTITIAAGGCAYLMIDGFAGDACNYSVTLTNITGGCVVLPIVLTSFDVVEDNGVVNIFWTTSVERDNDYFTIERSSDGINFTVIEKVISRGNSSVRTDYSVKDLKPEAGLMYYRLKQTDLNGSSTVSAVKTFYFTNNQDFNFNLVPNPSDESGFSLFFNQNPIQNYTLTIKDIAGKMIFKKEIFDKNNQVKVDEILESGLYFVEVISKNKNITKKLIVK